MNKIKIQNFGPIQTGYAENDGWIEIPEVTVFIGNQGSGKSTVAKLLSLFMWVEKAMVRGIVKEGEYSAYNRFAKLLDYHRMRSYLREGTVLDYEGKAFSLKFINGKFSAEKSVSNAYALPKIMYVPAERNFLSVVDRPDKLKDLPRSLYTFNDEYDKAKTMFAHGVELPINNVQFEYNKSSELAHIVDKGKGYNIRISEASSGFQSVVPLYLVTKYLSDMLRQEENLSVQENSLEEQKRLEREIKAILDDPQLTPEVRQASLRQLSARRKVGCFINIVEEPELNLYPQSQQRILHELLGYRNTAEDNKLIITTHSPYLINFLSIVIQCDYLRQSIPDEQLSEEIRRRLDDIVPEKSRISAQNIAIYELHEADGTISKLPDYHGIPSDKNLLNTWLEEGNIIFDKLLEIEQEVSAEGQR